MGQALGCQVGGGYGPIDAGASPNVVISRIHHKVLGVSPIAKMERELFDLQLHHGGLTIIHC